MELHSGINWKTNHDHRGVLTVSLNIHDHSVNTFNREVMEELRELIDSLEPLCKSTDHDTTTTERVIEAIVFKSGKPSGFIAGADIKDFEKNRQDSCSGRIYSDAFDGALDAIENMPVPTISKINGICVGGGCELSMATDIRIASGKSKFGIPVAKLGILVGYREMKRLINLAGSGNASYTVSYTHLRAHETLR